MKWKRYGYVQYISVTDSMKTSKIIDLLEDDILVTSFMEKFTEQTYQYIYSNLSKSKSKYGVELQVVQDASRGRCTKRPD